MEKNQQENCLKKMESVKQRRNFWKKEGALGNVYENSQDLKPMEGLVEFLIWLKTSGYKIGIVSSTNTRLIVTALNRMKLMSFPEVLICGDMVTKKKPSPEGYRKAMEYLEVMPGRNGDHRGFSFWNPGRKSSRSLCDRI